MRIVIKIFCLYVYLEMIPISVPCLSPSINNKTSVKFCDFCCCKSFILFKYFVMWILSIICNSFPHFTLHLHLAFYLVSHRARIVKRGDNVAAKYYQINNYVKMFHKLCKKFPIVVSSSKRHFLSLLGVYRCSLFLFFSLLDFIHSSDFFDIQVIC